MPKLAPPQRTHREQYGRVAGRKLQRIRHQYFAINPLCPECEKLGRFALAEQLDHVVPLSQGGLDIASNRQGLCKEHHAEKTRSDFGWRDKPTIGLDGFPEDDA